ncbi:MAG: DUF2059 domain-containing protein [Pseudomonadales bacterium]|jgi:hypothetical protein|nr:DUF2059 domain-containing protein [Pseudomonadales bacterium]
MRKLLTLIALLSSFGIHAAPASQESVEKLLAVTNVESMMESLYSSVEQMMRQSMQQAAQGKTLSAEEQRALDTVPAKFVALMREEASWQKLKPQYAQLYLETFDQEEVDGLLAFYSSSAGQALLNKMPLVIQKSMVLSQSLMQSLMPKMMAAINDALSEAQVPSGK